MYYEIWGVEGNKDNIEADSVQEAIDVFEEKYNEQFVSVYNLNVKSFYDFVEE